ncbi:hypothetical protein L3C95_01055 [Chitinophaga filiformis]|uniref:hypothetical protein n=1 Tax=Chitinophaga filiformis TaxID=104663 RepID=UPI001F434483|nr:hypothetical protein [Chitinophaga filiformis]MCF6401439.1 hypothetical protein [Chitinophaga filiformis]
MITKERLYSKILDLIEEEYNDVYFNNNNIVHQIEFYNLGEFDCINIKSQHESGLYDATHPKNKAIKIDLTFEVLNKEHGGVSSISVSGYNNLIQFIKFPKNEIEQFDLQTLKLTSRKRTLLNGKSVKRLHRKFNHKNFDFFELLEIENSFHYNDTTGKCYYSISSTEHYHYLVIDNSGSVYIYKHVRPKILRKSDNEIEIIGCSEIQITDYNIYTITRDEFINLKNCT